MKTVQHVKAFERVGDTGNVVGKPQENRWKPMNYRMFQSFLCKWYIYVHEWLFLMVNVGEYTIHGSYGVGGFKYLFVSSLVGEMIQISKLTNIFQRGWKSPTSILHGCYIVCVFVRLMDLMEISGPWGPGWNGDCFKLRILKVFFVTERHLSLSGCGDVSGPQR